MKKRSIPPKVPVYDLNFAAYQFLHGNIPELDSQGSRIIFLFNADESFYRLSEQYNRNEPVNVMDFVNTTRQLRAMMFAMKGGAR